MGSTRFFEERGDIEGLQLIRRHEELLRPVVAAHRGRVIKTLGDSIMASFEDGADALRCAAQMQRTLQAANRDGAQHPLHIRIGVHAGKAFLTGDDVFGDTVNTAARITREAGADEVLASASLFERCGAQAGLSGTRRAPLQLKGKAEPLPVAQVHWGEQRATEPQGRPLVVELRLLGEEVELALHEDGAEHQALQTFAASALSAEALGAATRRFEPFMHQGGDASYLASVRQLGLELFNGLFPATLRERLVAGAGRPLRLQVDAALAAVPFELLHDGAGFLGVRHALGRRVVARGETPPVQSATGRALVVADPAGTLPAAAQEGMAVAGLLRSAWGGEVEHLHGTLTRSRFLQALAGCELLHFAGHTEPPTESSRRGFVLSDGWVSAEEVAGAVGGAAPALVFANGCRTASGLGFLEAGKATADLASALLLRGTRHCVGPIWDISDEDALGFALRFYEQALQGTSIGEAVRRAREQLASGGRQPLSFAAYVLYGEPTLALARAPKQERPAPRMRSSRTLEEVPAIRLPVKPARKVPGWVRFALPAVALLAIGGALAFRLRGGPPSGGPDPAEEPVVPSGPTTTADPTPPVKPPVPRAPRHGPIRVCVLPFKNLTEDPGLDLRQALAELVTSDLAGAQGIRIIERPQVETQIHWIEFEQTQYVDPKTRTELGKLLGAEVAVLGGYQRLGETLRIYARFVDTETGEVLHGLKVDGSASAEKLFELQDRLGEQVRTVGGALEAKLRKAP